MICETCGAEMRKTVEGSTLTWSCPSCGDAVARTYIEPIREDATVYSLSIEGEGAASKDAIRAIAKIAGCNYLAAKRLIVDGGALLDGSAIDMREAARQLEAVGLPYAITPDFPYAIKRGASVVPATTENVLRENDIVAVRHNHPAEGIPAGAIGAVICAFDTPNRAYEVEFVGDGGRPWAQLTLRPDELLPLPAHRTGVPTPIGNVGLRVDGRSCANDGAWEIVDSSDYARRHPVDGNWRVAYWHVPDGAAHTLECRLDPSAECAGGSACGERLEATEIDDGKTALVIAVEYDFDDYAHGHGEYEYDYTATADGYAATVELPADAKAQWIVFGVSWVESYDEESRTNPWLVGDPGGDRLRLPTGVYEKDGSGPYGGRTIEWFLPIERPCERKADVLALFDGCEVVEHTNADEGYESLEDIESIIEVVSPASASDLWLGFGGEYTLGHDGTHVHYAAYEGDYRELKSDIKEMLADRLPSERAE